ncbi:uncharacterized protein LOC141900393 [Tubulanus polymorphus]|uniref:uncharacterized protein LOC141900393 n=1 Tax=Tubulanus polymorphus TaxID=672921 RepID=UPI003DA64E87
MNKMDFSQFRENGELSDIVVVVDGQEYNLHKFPLYIKSDFFKTLARDGSGAERDVVELTGFPGGQQTFATVADFCYGIKVDITSDNVVHLRCAAEFLMMTGKGNLADVADRYLHDVLTSAKFSRSTGLIVDILLQCCKLKDMAEKATITPRCIEAIIHIWLKPPTQFSNPRKKLNNDLKENEEGNMDKVQQLPLDLFKRLVITGRDRVVWPKTLAVAAQKYIGQYFNSDCEPRKSDEQLRNNPQTTKSPEEHDKQAEAPNIVVNDVENKPDEKQICNIMDELLLVIPEDTPMEDAVSTTWAVLALIMADKVGCKCRDRLVKLASDILHRFTSIEMEKLSCRLISEITEMACKSEKCVPDVVSRVIDTYLLDLAKSKELKPEAFITLAKSMPVDCRQNHDLLFEVLQELFKYEVDIEDDTRKEMLAVIDFCRLSENMLTKAHESELVPASYITRAALDLCARLRSELDSAKAIIRMQDEDLQRLSKLKSISNGTSKYSGNNSNWETASVASTSSIQKPRYHSAVKNFRTVDHNKDHSRSISPAVSIVSCRLRTSSTSEALTETNSPILTADDYDASGVPDFSSSGISSDDVKEVMNGLAELSPRYSNYLRTVPTKW